MVLTSETSRFVSSLSCHSILLQNLQELEPFSRINPNLSSGILCVDNVFQNLPFLGLDDFLLRSRYRCYYLRGLVIRVVEEGKSVYAALFTQSMKG